MSPRPRTLAAAVVLGLFLSIATSSVAPTTARAADVKTEVRLLTSEGKFDDADKLLDGNEELKNDPAFRAALAEAALRSAKPKKGEAKKYGVHAAIKHLHAALGGEGDTAQMVQDALEAAYELADLEIEAKNPKAAIISTSLAIDLADKAVKPESTHAGVLIAAADIHDKRADLSHPIEDMERIITDLGKSGDLLAAASKTHRETAKVMGWAARAYVKQAQFVNDKIPIKEEKRDEEAAKKAIEIATAACKVEGAPSEVFTNHLLALRAGRNVGLEDVTTEAFLEPVKPAVELLELKIPRGGIWKTRKTEGWDFHATRQFEGEDKSVEVLLKIWGHDEALYGILMNDVEKVVETRAEAQVGKFESIKSQSLPHLLGDAPPEPDDGKKKKKKKKKKRKKSKPKKGEMPQPDVWHFRIVGVPKVHNKPQQLAEFFWSNQKAGITYQIRILDWGTPWGIDDEDVAQFLRSAFGDQWPEAKKDEKKK